MSMPKGMFVAAHGEAYEQHMVMVKAHHMFWIRQFQHFSAEPTHLSMLPMLPHLSSESITISQLASLDAERITLYGEASKQRSKLGRSKVLRALDQEVLTFLSFTDATAHTSVLSIRLEKWAAKCLRVHGYRQTWHGQLRIYPRMFDKMNYGIYFRYG